MKYMNYKLFFWLALAIVEVSTYTDITMLNCPAQFDIAAYNTTSDSTVATVGTFIYAGFQSQATQDRV